MQTTIYAVVSKKQYAEDAFEVLTPPYNRRMDTIAKRLAALMAEKGLSGYALGKKSGVSQPTIKRILDGTSKEPDKSTVSALALVLGVSYSWLYDGAGPRDADPVETLKGIQNVGSHAGAQDLDGDYYVFVDRYDVKLSAGDGNVVWIIREKDPISFRESWFRKKNLNKDQCRAMYVRGRSMEPDLKDGDTVLIDLGDTEVIDGEIYAVAFKNNFYIKALEKTGDGMLLRSKNPEFKNIEVSEGDMQHLKIIGRNVWRGG